MPHGDQNSYISVNREWIVSMLWLWDDNKTTVAVSVNIYAVDCKGQSLVHVPLPFFHSSRREHALQMWESHSSEVRLEKRKLEAVWNKHLQTLWWWRWWWGGKHIYLCVLLIQKTSTKDFKEFNLGCFLSSWQRQIIPHSVWLSWIIIISFVFFRRKRRSILSGKQQMSESNFLAEVLSLSNSLDCFQTHTELFALTG